MIEKEHIIYFWKSPGIDPYQCIEQIDDNKESTLYIRDHVFVKNKNYKRGIYVCQDCGMLACINIGGLRYNQTTSRGTIMPFSSPDKCREYEESGQHDHESFIPFLSCDEMVVKEILE